jgi:hypothetical protein
MILDGHCSADVVVEVMGEVFSRVRRGVRWQASDQL